MVKLRKRRKKSRPARRQIRSEYDCHHLCFTRRSWDYGLSRKLRIHPYCRVLIPRDDLHIYIHKNMQYVAVPDDVTTKCALSQLALLAKYGAISGDDDIEKRLLVLTALFECIDQPTANGFREQLRLVREFRKSPH